MMLSQVGAQESSKSAMKRSHRRVQGVDDHLAIDRPGDLDAPVDEVRRHRGDAPVAGAHLRVVSQKLRQRAGIEQGLAARAGGEQFQAARIEAAVQTAEQLQRERCQHLLVTLNPRSQDLDLRSRFLPGAHFSVRLDVHGPPSIRGPAMNLTIETSHC